MSLLRRHIFVGDVHGCFDELLSRVAVSDSDVVVALGDLTRKGPAPDRCVELWIERQYFSVLGNNDVKMLERAERWPWPFLASASDRRILRRGDLLQSIRRWLYLDFPEIDALAVHGGVLPNSDRFLPELVPREAALELRYIRPGAQGQWRMIPTGAWSRFRRGNNTRDRLLCDVFRLRIIEPYVQSIARLVKKQLDRLHFGDPASSCRSSSSTCFFRGRSLFWMTSHRMPKSTSK